MKNRPSFEAFKEKAMQREDVQTEYNALMPIFELKNQMIKARLEANFSQEDVANILHTKKSNISRLESPNSKIFQIFQHCLNMQRQLGLILKSI